MDSRDLDQACLSTLTILLVEDDSIVRAQTGQLLRRHCRKLVLAGNGQEGLERFQQHQPDLVVTDIQMPGMDGLELAAALRAQGRQEPIVVVTAFERPEYTLRSIEAGVDGYVLKPVQAEQLEEVLRHCARIVRERRELREAELRDGPEPMPAEREPRTQVDRLYTALIQTNQAVLRLRDETELFQRICDIATEFGGFPLAWIGLQAPEGRPLRVAASGSALDGLDGIIAALGSTAPCTWGPAGTGGEDGACAVIQEFQAPPARLPWQELAGRRGIRASAAFPIRRSGLVIGALTVYADRPRFFDDENVALLGEIVSSLGFALDHLGA